LCEYIPSGYFDASIINFLYVFSRGLLTAVQENRGTTFDSWAKKPPFNAHEKVQPEKKMVALIFMEVKKVLPHQKRNQNL
jgi:hypothetical protein